MGVSAGIGLLRGLELPREGFSARWDAERARLRRCVDIPRGACNVREIKLLVESVTAEEFAIGRQRPVAHEALRERQWFHCTLDSTRWRGPVGRGLPGARALARRRMDGTVPTRKTRMSLAKQSWF